MFRMICLASLGFLTAGPALAQDIVAAAVPEQLASDDLRCADQVGADYSGEWCKGFRTGKLFGQSLSQNSTGVFVVGTPLPQDQLLSRTDLVQALRVAPAMLELITPIMPAER